MLQAKKKFSKNYFIFLIHDELISDLCGKINQKDFKYSSIYNFYYIVSLTYNKAIKGFLEIIKEMGLNDENEDDNNDAPPLQ